MNNPPVFLSFTPRQINTPTTIVETKTANIPVINTEPPDTVIGKNIGPKPIASVESTIQLPIISPTARSKCFFLMAETSTTSSGRLVPRLTKKKLIRYSDIPKNLLMAIADSMTK